MRYWRLSRGMELHDHPDRLIICVHHPSPDGDAGMDLYKVLKEQQVTWDDLEAAAVEEYRLLGRSIEAPQVICRSDGTLLFPSAPQECQLTANICNRWGNKRRVVRSPKLHTFLLTRVLGECRSKVITTHREMSIDSGRI